MKTVFTMILVLAMTACGGSDAPEAEVAEPAADTRLTDAVNEPLDKAKAVEDLAQQRKADMDAKLEEMEGTATTDDTP
ncbi:MAG: hypothetical protein AAF004_07265 [Pseudomonadota bacterium]